VTHRSRDWRRRKNLAVFLLALSPALLPLAAGAGMAAGQDDAVGERLQAFAVHINRKPKQSWPGYGIYLGNGLVISAAHVVGHSFFGGPNVEIAGRMLPSSIVKAGEFETTDLTLLRIDSRRLPASLGLRLMPLCGMPPRAGQKVIVATPEAVSTSHILSPKALPPNLRNTRFDTLIADVATTGNSGSGVFDPVNQCLMGIMSRKLQSAGPPKQPPDSNPKLYDIAKYFIPAREIVQFIRSN
jgi:hypothetical protein